MAETDSHYGEDEYFPTIHGDRCKVINNTFSYGSLTALFVNGWDNVIENNLIHDFDYSSSLVYSPLQISKNWAYYEGKAGRAKIRYNTIYNSGGILMEFGQVNNEVSGNHLYDCFLSCFGGNKDHSALYTQSLYCKGSRAHHNWVHDGYAGTSPIDWGRGIGIRGDDNTAGLTVDHNVVWNMGSAGILIKSPANPTPDQANHAINNTIFNVSKLNSSNNTMIFTTKNSNHHIHSTIYNNIAETIYGGWYNQSLLFLTNIGYNFKNKDIPFEQSEWWDFRPAKGSNLINKGTNIAGLTDDATDGLPDIGAYDRGASVYMIPGQRSSIADFPIVPDNSIDISPERDVLMWRPAYNAVAHNVYFGTDKEAVEIAGIDDPVFGLKLTGDNNVFTLTELNYNLTYYWRVDAIMADNSVNKGNVWKFSTESVIIDSTNPKKLSSTIYTNPTSGEVFLAIQGLKEWKVYDINAQIILSGNSNGFDMTSFEPGIYFICTNSGNFKILKK
jgi:hypothetical protein